MSEFDKEFESYKSGIALTLVRGQESSRVPNVIEKIDLNKGLAKHFFDLQQAKIDQLKAENERLERKLRWSEALRNNQFEHLLEITSIKAGLQNRIDDALFKMRQQSLMLREDMDGYKDPVQLCQSEGIDMGVNILEKTLRGEHESNQNSL